MAHRTRVGCVDLRRDWEDVVSIFWPSEIIAGVAPERSICQGARMGPGRSPEERVPISNASVYDVEELLALDPVAQADARRRTQIRTWVSEGLAFVAHRDGRIVGYGVLEHSFFGRAFIAMVYVDPSERRRGLGTSIVEHLEQRAETPTVFTSTNQSNTPMQRLLERFGYERSGRIENLDPGDPELVYSKPKVVLRSE